VGRFRVTTNPTTGLKEIGQVLSPVEEPKADDEVDLDAELDASLEADLRAELEGHPDTPVLEVSDGGAADDDVLDEAANEIMAGLYEQNVSWVKKRVPDIKTQAGIEAVREMEKAHPKKEGGRSGVLNALDERSGELVERKAGPGDIEEPPETTMGTGLPCSECDFTAGSEAGLDAHMEAKHPDIAL